MDHRLDALFAFVKVRNGQLPLAEQLKFLLRTRRRIYVAHTRSGTRHVISARGRTRKAAILKQRNDPSVILQNDRIIFFKDVSEENIA